MKETLAGALITGLLTYIVARIFGKIIDWIDAKKAGHIQKKLAQHNSNVSNVRQIDASTMTLEIRGHIVIVHWHSFMSDKPGFTDFKVLPAAGDSAFPFQANFSAELYKYFCPRWRPNPTPEDFRRKKMLTIHHASHPVLRDRLRDNDALLETMGNMGLAAVGRIPIPDDEPAGIMDKLTRYQSVSLTYLFRVKMSLDNEGLGIQVCEHIEEPKRVEMMAGLCVTALEQTMKMLKSINEMGLLAENTDD